MLPYVLKTRVSINGDADFPAGVTFDVHRQIWIFTDTGKPFISADGSHPQETKYGETSLTETREGADQSECVNLQSSNYGETTMTKTFEGADQSEGSLTPSSYGETSVTATREGLDQSDIISNLEFGLDAPHSHF